MRKKKLLLYSYLVIFIGIVILDQATKYWAEKNFLTQFSSASIHDYISSNLPIFHIGSENWLDFSITYVRNTGAAWGFLGNLPENIRPYFFYVLTATAMLLVLYFFYKTESSKTITRLGIVFIFSGAMGNYIDRVNLHYVIDWIHFKWNFFGWEYDYPVFNIADCGVSIGVGILIIETIIVDFFTRK